MNWKFQSNPIKLFDTRANQNHDDINNKIKINKCISHTNTSFLRLSSPPSPQRKNIYTWNQYVRGNIWYSRTKSSERESYENEIQRSEMETPRRRKRTSRKEREGRKKRSSKKRGRGKKRVPTRLDIAGQRSAGSWIHVNGERSPISRIAGRKFVASSLNFLTRTRATRAHCRPVHVQYRREILRRRNSDAPFASSEIDVRSTGGAEDFGQPIRRQE